MRRYAGVSHDLALVGPSFAAQHIQRQHGVAAVPAAGAESGPQAALGLPAAQCRHRHAQQFTRLSNRNVLHNTTIFLFLLRNSKNE
jgi:hypothetical protein